MKGYTVEVNKEKNYLILRIQGTMYIEDTDSILASLRDALNQLTPGFVFIHDLSKLDLSAENAIRKLLTIHEILGERGCSKIIRVKGRPDSMITKEFDFINRSSIVPTEYFNSLDDILLVLQLKKIQEGESNEAEISHDYV